MRTDHFIEELEVEITRNECRERGKELGRQHQLLREHKVKSQQVKSQLASEEKKLNAEIERLATIVHTGREVRAVTCQEIADDRRFEVSVIRMDTGATISTRPMSQGEREQCRQGNLFAFQEDVRRAHEQGARLAREAREIREDLDRLRGNVSVEVEMVDEPEYDEETGEVHSEPPADEGEDEDESEDESEDEEPDQGSEQTPTPMPEPVDLSPTNEDETNWAKNRHGE